MAPSAVESVQQTVDEIKQKVLPISDTKSASHTSTEVKVELGSDSPGALPERYESHKEPLKLSGALDHLEQFDVTPVIGREYVNVNLADLLKAPNSDELLRDLAITSKAPPR